MKQTCYGCRALCTTFDTKCELFHPINVDYNVTTGITKISPKEECEKPKTMSEYITAHHLRQKQMKQL